MKRCEAFDDIIKEYPDIKLITEQHVPAEQPINDAEEITANLLTANPDKDSVTAIFAAWDEPAIGAAKALAEAGRDEVIVTGVDGNEQAVQMIKDGSCLKATVKQNFEGMAEIVCQQMESYCGTCGDMDFSGYAGETPLWGGGYQVDFNEIGKLNIPAVLMGPWGKDIHRRTERVNRKSLLVELPEILHTLIEDQA